MTWACPTVTQQMTRSLSRQQKQSRCVPRVSWISQGGGFGTRSTAVLIRSPSQTLPSFSLDAAEGGWHKVHKTEGAKGGPPTYSYCVGCWAGCMHLANPVVAGAATAAAAAGCAATCRSTMSASSVPPSPRTRRVWRSSSSRRCGRGGSRFGWVLFKGVCCCARAAGRQEAAAPLVCTRQLRMRADIAVLSVG